MAGYIGTQPVPQATQTRDAFTATAGQTSFPTSGYTPEFLDVFLNGVKLAAADYTATNGSDVVLAAGATTGDILEVVSYGTFEVLNPTFDGNVTFTGNASFGDNDKAIFGAGSDLQIYHNGSHSYVKDAGTGDLYLQGSSAIRFTDPTQSENFAVFNHNGAVNLYHDSSLKFQTLSTGINVIGTVAATSYTGDGSSLTGVGSPSIDDNGNATAITIDASENVLVGLTATEAVGTNAGTQLRADGLVYAAVTSDSHILSRRTTDGAILTFRKDTTAAGRIGNNSGFFIGGAGAGIRLQSNDIIPTEESGNLRDGTKSLGSASARWQDLYLSGGVYLGGTGSANKLDDYEEGTFTPSVLNGWGVTNPTYSAQSGFYTKVGNTVYVVFHIILSGGSINSNKLALDGFPFTNFKNTASAESTLNGFFFTAASQPSGPPFLVMPSNGSKPGFARTTNSSGRTDFTGTEAGAGFNLSFSGTYLTA